MPRTDPILQGKHFPHDSTAVNSNKCSMYFSIENSCGIDTILACPNKNPSCSKLSKSRVRLLILCTGTIPPSGPPICSAFTGNLNPPPKSSIIIFREVPISISYIPGVLKKESKQTSLVPVDLSVPNSA